MKAATCAFTAAASMLAASTATLATAAAAATSSSAVGSNEGNSPYVKAKIFVARSSEKEKFAPRFDGLRFIETLVTAHR